MFNFKPEILIYFRQLAVMTDAGMGFLPSLQILAAQPERDLDWSDTKDSVVASVERGSSLSKALSKHPRYFAKSQIIAIKSGEKSGSLGRVLGMLEEKLIDEQKTKGRLQKALTYPTVLIILSLTGTFLMFKYVLPGILAGTNTSSAEFLPTKILVLLVAFFNSWVGLFLTAFAVVGVLLFLRKPSVQRAAYFMALDLPALGGLLRNAACLEFAVNFKLLIGAGSAVASAVEFSLSGNDSPALQRAAPLITKRIMQGDSVHEAFCQHGTLFSNLLLDMLALIDETSEYDSSLAAAIQYLSFDVEQKVDQFLNIIEPVILLIVSMFIAFVAIAVIVPIVQLGASL